MSALKHINRLATDAAPAPDLRQALDLPALTSWLPRSGRRRLPSGEIDARSELPVALASRAPPFSGTRDDLDNLRSGAAQIAPLSIRLNDDFSRFALDCAQKQACPTISFRQTIQNTITRNSFPRSRYRRAASRERAKPISTCTRQISPRTTSMTCARRCTRKIVLDGGSYGTTFFLDYARRHPARVESIVLQGVAPPDMLILLEDAQGAQTASTIFLQIVFTTAPVTSVFHT